MLRHIGEFDAAIKIRNALEKVYRDRINLRAMWAARPARLSLPIRSLKLRKPPLSFLTGEWFFSARFLDLSLASGFDEVSRFE